MLERISNGIALTKQSFRVLMMDKELLLFPVFSGISCLLVLAGFAGPLWASGAFERVLDDGQPKQNVLVWVISAAYYFVNYFVIIFFNSALVACAAVRLNGGNPTVGDGLRASMARLPQICGWAALSATVGMILKAIESRSERAGQFVASLLGLAWTVTTFFVVPVLVVEKLGPFEATKRSLSVVRNAWGEAMTANFGVSLITFVSMLPGILGAITGLVMLFNDQQNVGIAIFVVGGSWLLIVSLVSSALTAIVQTALYLYAAEDHVPDGFDQNVLRHAFAAR